MRTPPLAVSLFLAVGPGLASPLASADDAPPPAAAREKEATRSRSNIQNNREAPAPGAAEPAAGAEATDILKTKTKSNQSND